MASDVEALHAELAALAAENRRLKGQLPPPRGDVDALAANAALWREMESLRSRLPGALLPGHLTKHQVASRLGWTLRRVDDVLGRQLVWRADAQGMPCVAETDFERAVLRLSDDEPAGDFL